MQIFCNFYCKTQSLKHGGECNKEDSKIRKCNNPKDFEPQKWKTLESKDVCSWQNHPKLLLDRNFTSGYIYKQLSHYLVVKWNIATKESCPIKCQAIGIYH
jgi:hypothetical protein